VTYLLEGSSVEQAAALVDRDLLEDDPLGAFDRSFRAQIQGFSAVGALERICPHPIGVSSVTVLVERSPRVLHCSSDFSTRPVVDPDPSRGHASLRKTSAQAKATSAAASNAKIANSMAWKVQ
jgi:hypothetical protein